MTLAAMLATQGCSDEERTASTSASSPVAGEQSQASPATSSLPRVAESFEVGSQTYVRSLAVESESSRLWVGTSTGVLEIDLATHEPRNVFTREHGLANEYVFAIDIDSRGYKWFGTNAGGLSRYKDGDWQVYFPMHGLADYWVYSFKEQPGGTMWVGTWAGANSVDLDTMSFTTYVDELINEWVYAIDIDSKGRVWFGTEGGISMFDGQSWRHWTHEHGLGGPNAAALPASANTGLGTRSRHSLSVLVDGEESYNPNYVFSLLVDSSDRVWAGTWGGGVARFDGTSWSNMTVSDGLPGNIVYSLARDSEGTMWFGTNRGLARYEDESWTVYTRADGLLEEHVYSIAIEPGGDIWAGTKRGVTRLAVGASKLPKAQ